MLFNNNFNFSGQSFYGKRIEEFSKMEHDLLINDMMLQMTLLLESKSGTKKLETQIRHLIAMRYSIISMIMDISDEEHTDENTPQIMDMIDNSIYGWGKFQHDLKINQTEYKQVMMN